MEKMQEILKIQTEQLAEWAIKLNDQCLKALIRKVANENAKLNDFSDPYSVYRGCQLSEFVGNWEGNFVLVQLTSTGIFYQTKDKNKTTEVKDAEVFHKKWHASDEQKNETWSIITITL